MTAGLGARRVKAIAAAKHHTVAATEGGEVFTWGSNRGTSWCTFQLSSLGHRSDDWFHLFFLGSSCYSSISLSCRHTCSTYRCLILNDALQRVNLDIHLLIPSQHQEELVLSSPE